MNADKSIPNLQLRPLTDTLGAEITGIDLRAPVDAGRSSWPRPACSAS